MFAPGRVSNPASPTPRRPVQKLAPNDRFQRGPIILGASKPPGLDQATADDAKDEDQEREKHQNDCQPHDGTVDELRGFRHLFVGFGYSRWCFWERSRLTIARTALVASMTA